MRIAIHHRKSGFSEGWITYCKNNKIEYKIVDCYSNDIIKEISDCDALMWHHHNANPRDVLFAKQLLYSVEMSGKKVYPDFRTCWHFDDKVGQKYLLESIRAPLVHSYVFYEKNEALRWAEKVTYPKVFKLRSGSGSDNVSLVKNHKKAIGIINKAFSSGFSQYNSWGSLVERWRKYRDNKTDFEDLLDGVGRLLIPTTFSKTKGPERGYVYFQEFVPNNNFDIRVTYVFGKCFALRRKVRSGDFRASGSGNIDYDMSKIPKDALKIAFEVANKLKLQTAAFDFVTYNEKPLIIEMSYGFGYDQDQFNYGYWDVNLNYYPTSFDPYGWMVEGIINSISKDALYFD